MEYFAQNLGWWSLLFVPAMIYVGLDRLLRPAAAGPARKRLPGLTLALLAAGFFGTLIAFGLIDIVCTWAVDLAVPHLTR